MQEWNQRLFGISMDLPATFLNATVPFTPPEASPLEGGDKSELRSTSFLWQAPNSNAILFMGAKWMELHGFVSQILEVQQDTDSIPSMLSDKDVSTRYPAWLEHALRLSRARGYFTHYPSPDTAGAVATVHRDLFRLPEEYEKKAGQKVVDKGPSEVVLTSSGLLDTLPYGGSLVAFNNLPLLTWDGELTTLSEMDKRSRQYTLEFRHLVGRCSGKDVQSVKMDGSATDLFCEVNSRRNV
jgi:hypothetical protein